MRRPFLCRCLVVAAAGCTGDGGYAYLGFEHPSEGRVSVDGSTRRFAGGHLDGGEFVPVEDRPGQYTLTAPGIDERWSCKDTRS